MFQFKREFSFMKYRRIYYLVAVIVLVVGIGGGFLRGFNYGIDFTGGTRFQINMGREVSVKDVQDVLKANHLEADVVHAGDQNQEIIIKTTQAMDTAAREKLLGSILEEFNLNKDAVLSTNQFGPSIGELLKVNAFKAVVLASLGMLIYVIIRFEWKFGVAAILADIHDVLVMIAFYGLFQVPINNPFIAAVLTVLGYSINDTIVIFDRIRENLQIMKKNKLEELIDKSINQTLVRSLMTSVTSIIAIIPIYILGGETIREFTLPLIIGIVAGAGSSIFIASPIYYELCMISGGPKYKVKKSKK